MSELTVYRNGNTLKHQIKWGSGIPSWFQLASGSFVWMVFVGAVNVHRHLPRVNGVVVSRIGYLPVVTKK